MSPGYASVHSPNKMDSQTLFELALGDLQKGYTTRAATRLRQASTNGHEGAQLELGKFLLRFGPRHPGVEEGISWIARSAASGFPAARHAMSALNYLQGNYHEALVELNLAAESGWIPSMIALSLFWAEHGNLHNAAGWLQKASSHSKTALCLSRLLKEKSSYTQPLDKWMPYKERSTDRTDWDARLFIRTIDHFSSRLEQAWLRLHAEPQLERARVFNPVTGRSESDPIRDNRAMHFGLPPLEPVVVRLVHRIASVLDTGALSAEPLAILNYSQDERYLSHYDGLGSAAIQRDPLGHSGNRAYTALIYLNSPLSGGGTAFPKLGVEIRPTPGRLLVFANLKASTGELDPLSLHTGSPVHQGVKWLASIWFRENDIFRVSSKQ